MQPSLESVAKDTTKGKPISVPVTRTYYIQAEFDIWNYAPAGLDRCGPAAGVVKYIDCSLGLPLHGDAAWWLDMQRVLPEAPIVIPSRCTGQKFEGDQQLYTMQLNNTLGPKAYKALYRAYSGSQICPALC